MAYMSQERKRGIAAQLKQALAGTGLKYTLAVRNHSTLVCTVKAAPVDFIANYNETLEGRNGVRATTYLDVNPYYYHEQFTGRARELVCAIMECLHNGNHDRSDAMTDYFDVGWYVDLNFGRYDKPFVVLPQQGGAA